VELVEEVELGFEGEVEDGAVAGLDDEESALDEAGLSEDFVVPLSDAFFESDFESEVASPELEPDSLELDEESESLEPELLGA
jgi:hypothetical protein